MYVTHAGCPFVIITRISKPVYRQNHLMAYLLYFQYIIRFLFFKYILFVKITLLN